MCDCELFMGRDLVFHAQHGFWNRRHFWQDGSSCPLFYVISQIWDNDVFEAIKIFVVPCWWERLLIISTMVPVFASWVAIWANLGDESVFMTVVQATLPLLSWFCSHCSFHVIISTADSCCVPSVPMWLDFLKSQSMKQFNGDLYIGVLSLAFSLWGRCNSSYDCWVWNFCLWFTDPICHGVMA